jgi:hypothetical protein
VDLIADSAKCGEPFLFRSLRRRGIFERPMQPLDGDGKDGARFPRRIADGDQEIGRIPEEFIDGFGALAGDVDASLRHDGNCFRTDATRLRAGREDCDAIAGMVAEKTFGHLTPRRISGAEDEEPLHAALGTANQCRVRLQAAQTESMIGTSARAIGSVTAYLHLCDRANAEADLASPVATSLPLWR